MGVLKIAPNYIPESNQFYFRQKDLNSFQRAEYSDGFGFWQSTFGIYTFMTMNNLGKYRVIEPNGHPLMWQPYESCSYTPTGSLSIGQRELEPCKAYLHEKWCHDELFDSCFEHLVEFNADGSVDLDDEGVRIFNQFTSEMQANANLAARNLLSVGQLYDTDSVEFADNTPVNLQNIFKRTTSTCRGWVKLFIDLAEEGFSWLNCPGILPSEIEDCNFQGSVLDMFDALKCKAPKKLRRLINQGGALRGAGRRFRPLLIVSETIYNALVSEYHDQCEKFMQNCPRIVKEVIGGGIAEGGREVYLIDGVIPVIPLCEINGYDEYLKVDTHFIGIVGSGNIQLGTSFGSIEDIEGDGVGVLVEKDTSIKNGTYGKYFFLSHALFVSALADPHCAVAAIAHS